MNFSKKGVEEKQQRIQSPSIKLAKKSNIILYRLIIICCVAIVIIGGVSAYGAISGLIDNAPSVEDIDVQPSGARTYVYDNHDSVIQTLVASQANRDIVSIERIPKLVQLAFVDVEDERFYQHKGIDVRGIFRAFFIGLSQGNFSEGASTITQQLLKNQVFQGGNEANFLDSLQRKIQEQYLAIEVENIHTKSEILESYLNTINLGSNTLGVQAASQRYFDKNVEDLNLSEATVIAGITQNPSGLNPITNPENNKKRRLEVLNTMLRLNHITQEEYDDAIDDPVYDRISAVNEQVANSASYNSYFVDATIDQVLNDLQTKLGYTSSQASKLLYSGGLRIYTTQDSELQSTCDNVLNDETYYPKNTVYSLEYRLSIQKTDDTQKHYSEGHLKQYFTDIDKKNGVAQNSRFELYFNKKEDAQRYIDEFKNHVMESGDQVIAENVNFKLQPQISFTLMDQTTGQVKAIVGGRGQKEGNRTLNRATNSLRQPGSTFKILSTYLPALNSSGMTLASVFDDTKYYYPGTKTQVNNASRKYSGLTTIREAIKKSINVVAVKTLEEVTPEVGYEYLQKLGFTSLVDQYVDNSGGVHSDINLPLALGGITNGVSNLELTAAYATIANGGVYNKPIFYTKITDSNGNVLLENKSESRQVIKESTAWLLTDAMKDVVKSGGTGSIIQFKQSKMPIAGKTGTTTNDVDLWFAGYTPYYTAAIWGGYDYGKDQSDTTYHKKIWAAIMDQIHAKLAVKDFSKPDSITAAKICTKSGKLAVDGVCNLAQRGSTVRTEYFAKGTVPTEKCDAHIALKICTDSGELATEYCPNTETKVYLLKDEIFPTPDSELMMPTPDLDHTKCHIHTAPIAPVDPNAQPVDPNAQPVDPNAQPVDPNAQPVDPNTQPVDPNSQNQPIPQNNPGQ